MLPLVRECASNSSKFLFRRADNVADLMRWKTPKLRYVVMIYAQQMDRARKRGSGRPASSLDFSDAEMRYSREPSHEETPERLFERRWGLALLQRVQRLREEHGDPEKPSYSRC